MTAVPQKTLNWLYSVLSKDYHDARRTYSDIARTLSLYPTLAPRTDVHTFENGTSALLLRLVGTLPVSFRDETYRFPITVWTPYGYPHEPPMVYVTSNDAMIVRAGQHVSGDGRVYHHYLAHWTEAWDRSNLSDFLSLLQAIFAKEPPVVAKQQQISSLRPTQSGPPPLPPLPEQFRRPFGASESLRDGLQGPAPPPPPPKESSSQDTPSNNESRSLGRYDAPPPLPPLPMGNPVQRLSSGTFLQNGSRYDQPAGPQHAPHRPNSLRQPQGQPYQSTETPTYDSTTRSPLSRQSHNPLPFSPQTTSHQPAYSGHPSYAQPQQTAYQSQHLPYQVVSPQSQFTPQAYPPPNAPPEPPRAQHPVQQPRPKADDLLTSPFEISLPSASDQQRDLPAPPIPRNPEKDALLHTLSHTLTQQLHNSIQQNQSALMPLLSQQSALDQTLQKLETELGSLTQLQQTLKSNSAILQSSLQQADNVIRDAQKRQQRGEVPRIDEILTAPTVVGKQLYETVAQQRGLDAAVWALQAALVRGRVGGELWARQTRTLAREAFLKRALENKIAEGLGLD